MTTVLLVLVIILTLAASAFFSGAETGFLSVSRARVLHLAREGGRKAKIVQDALKDMSRTTTTLLIGNNLVNVSYSSASAALILAVFADSRSQSIASFVAACIVLYVSEFMPKLLFAARPLRRTLLIAPTYRVLAIFLSPFTVMAMKVTNLLIPKRESKYKLTPDELLRILQDRKDGVCLSDFESALITRLIVLRIKGRPVTREAVYDALTDDEMCV